MFNIQVEFRLNFSTDVTADLSYCVVSWLWILPGGNFRASNFTCTKYFPSRSSALFRKASPQNMLHHLSYNFPANMSPSIYVFFLIITCVFVMWPLLGDAPCNTEDRQYSEPGDNQWRAEIWWCPEKIARVRYQPTPFTQWRAEHFGCSEPAHV